MQKVVFIAGLSHIGSTMLDMILGNQPRLIGLGEIYSILRPELNRINQNVLCSCGAAIDKCTFWGEAAKYIRPALSKSMVEKYEIVLSIFNKVYGSDYVLVDSSKSLEALKVVLKIPNIEIKVVHLLRDVRGWTISRLDYRKRFPQHYSSNGYYFRKLKYSLGSKIYLLKYFIPCLTKMPSYYFLLWYFQNKQITSFLKSKKVFYHQISYDELGMHTSEVMEGLFNYIGISNKWSAFKSVNTKSHVVLGNPGKTDYKRRQGIFYDNRWLYRNDWRIAAAMFQNIMKYNSNNVYKNIRNESIWEA